MTEDRVKDLKFIHKVLSELHVNPDDYDFGPAFQLAKDEKKLALIKLQRIIREAKLELKTVNSV